MKTKNLGKWIFPVTFLVFGIMHLLNADVIGSYIPSWIPGKLFWAYITGLAQIAFAVSVYSGKYDKSAARLLALMLLIFIVVLHLPNVGQDPTAMGNLLKDLGLMAGALMYAEGFAKGK